jgi:hypothetical protein
MTARDDLILKLRMRGVALHSAGAKGPAQLFGRTIEALLKAEHPRFRQALASELKLTKRALGDHATRCLIQEAVNELEPSASA